MLNVPIRAADEAVPAVSRRAFLRTSASAGLATAAAGSALALDAAAVAAAVAAEPAAVDGDGIAEIRRLIESHRAAEAAFEEYLNGRTKIELALIADRQANPNTGKTEEERQAIEDARDAAFGWPEFHDVELEHMEAGIDALGELLDYPMTTFAQVIAKVGYLRTIRDFFNVASAFEDPEGAFFDAFFPDESEVEAVSNGRTLA